MDDDGEEQFADIVLEHKNSKCYSQHEYETTFILSTSLYFTPTGEHTHLYRVLLSYVSQSVCGHALDRQKAVFCCHSVNGQDCRKTLQRCRNRLACTGSRQVHRQLQWFPYTLSRVSQYLLFVLTDSDDTNHLHMVAGLAARTTHQNTRMQANITSHRGSKVHKPP